MGGIVMTRDGRPETGVSAVSDPETARRWDTWRRWVQVLNANLMGPAFRAGRPWAWCWQWGRW
jgi:hypothetical protein